MYQRLSTQCDRVIVGGESAGGLLSLYLAGHRPEITALLLFAPALRLNLNLTDSILLRLLALFIPWVPKKNLDSNDLWQGYRVNPLKGVMQLMQLQKRVRPLLPKIKQPVLIIQGKLDTTVHPSVPEMVYDQVGSTIKEKYWMEHSSHCVIIDREFELVTAHTTHFLNRVLSVKSIIESS